MSGAAIVPAVAPLLLIAAGLVALGAGVAILRSLGSNFRVGRLLGVTPIVSIAEAIALAAGPPRYVGVRGRIDSTEEFEDEAHRPLVLRRTRFQLRSGPGWRTVDEVREAVAFEIRDGLDAIGIDKAAISAGLVVIPRESVGTAGDAPDHAPAGTPGGTPLRLRVEQVSSVEHATVLGVPRLDAASGRSTMGAGLGRPLILSTLENDEAMRVLAGDGPRRPLAAVIVMAVGLVSLAAGLAWALLGAVTGTARAASPVPSAAIGGDPRSSGQGPGLVGDPLAAIAIVMLVALAAVVLTTVYIRLTGGRRS
jgi:hypothetical protein